MTRGTTMAVRAVKCMRGHAIGILVAAGLAGPGLALAQGTREPAPDPLATFRVGHWVKVLGAAQGATPASCLQLKLLTGDFLDDDWAVRGSVTAVDRERREFRIGGCRVQVTDNTTFESPNRNFKSYADVRPGSYVEVEGTFLSTGILLAAEVDDEADELAKQPKTRDQIEMVGKIERLDTRKRVVALMGMDFTVTPKTQVRSVLR